MQRPKRACTERAQEKIREILQWEACSENSKLFKDVEAQMDRELHAEVRTRDYAPSSTSESDSHSDDACSECSACSACSECSAFSAGSAGSEGSESEAVDKKDDPFDPTAEE